MSDSSSNEPVVRLLADFHNADPQGRLRLNCEGTREDISRTGIRLAEGLRLVVYSEDVEAEASVTFSKDENLWVAVIDWDKIISPRDPQ